MTTVRFDRRWLLVLLAAGVLSLPLAAAASSCGMLSYSVDESRSQLRRAANETDFESAKDEARRAKNALEDSAMAAMDCGCHGAYGEFDYAATYARRARDAEGRDEFVYNFNRSIRSFNDALEQLRACARKAR